MIEPDHNSISVRRQRQLIGLSRASLYYEPAEESAENLLLMRLLDDSHRQDLANTKVRSTMVEFN